MDPQTIIAERRLLVAFTAPDNKPHLIGEAVGYYSRPVYILVSDNGRTTWPESLTREATPEEAIEYWRNRALAAEGQQAGGNGE